MLNGVCKVRAVPRTLRTFAFLLVVLTASALSACGGKSEGSVKDLLDKAFSSPIKSANVNLDLSLKVDGVQQLKDPVKLSLQGPYESGGGKTIPKVDWDIAVNAAGQSFSAGFVSTGDNAFVKFQGASYEVGAQAVTQLNNQIKQAAGKSNSKKGLSQFGIQPRNWIKDAKDEGGEKVAGTDTTHVSAKLDVGAFLDDVNKLVQRAGGNLPGGAQAQQLTADQKKQIQDVVKNPKFDVYVGKSDNTIRRLSADISFDVPKNQQARVQGLSGGQLSFSIEFADVGKPQTIKTPTGAKPITELTSKLGGLGSALGGSGSGASGATGSSGSGSSGPSQKALQDYSKCLQKANPSDAAALQKCSDLLK
jgi:hypothetical protein